MRRDRSRTLLLLPLLLAPAALAQEGGARGRVTPRDVVLPHPAPKAGALFGFSVAWLDLEGDGELELAVGAPGEGAVYLFAGPELATWRRVTAEELGARSSFGSDLAAGPLDDEPGDELVIGASGADERAGAVFVLSKGDEVPRRLEFDAAEGSMLGTSVALGDYDGDGRLDVAAGAPKTLVGGEPSGGVLVHSLAKGESWRLENPIGTWKHGNYGHDLATGDADGDGIDDLFVSSLGNRSEAGVRGAGQVYVHLGPLPSGARRVAEDPTARPKDGARFGMSIAAGDVDGDGRCDLLVGSPRKDGGGILDAGQGFVFFGPSFASDGARALLHPQAKEQHVLGFRALVANVVGDERDEVLFACLGGPGRRALLIWERGELDAEPWVLNAPAEGTGHFVQGLAATPAKQGERQTLALGDIDFDPGIGARCGRVVIWRFDG